MLWDGFNQGFLPRGVLICSEPNHLPCLPESCLQRWRALLIYMLVLLRSAIFEVAVTAGICFFYVIEKPQGQLLFFPLSFTPEACSGTCGIRAATRSFSASFHFVIPTSLWANFSTVGKVVINLSCCFPIGLSSIFNGYSLKNNGLLDGYLCGKLIIFLFKMSKFFCSNISFISNVLSSP